MSAWSRSKIWGAEILYPADLNAEFNAGMNAYNAHRTNATIDHPDASITPAKLDANVSKYTIILIPAGAVFPASNPPELVQINGTNNSYFVADFDKATDEKCDWHFTIPANWDSGNITAKIKYIANATTGNVMWVVSHKGISETESIDQALTDEAFSADTVDETANNLCIASKTFALTGITTGEWVILRLKRDADDAGDTLDADARLLEIVIEWTI